MHGQRSSRAGFSGTTPAARVGFLKELGQDRTCIMCRVRSRGGAAALAESCLAAPRLPMVLFA